MKWEVLSSKYLIQRPWLTARKDVVKLPTGVINEEFYVLEYPDWVNIIAITQEGEFILIRQYRHGLKETNFEIVAGVVEEGEDTLTAAKRELLEESGYGGGKWTKIMEISGNASTTNNLTHCYLAKGVKLMTSQQLDATEDIEVHLVSHEKLFSMLSQGQIRQSLMAAPLWKFFYEEKNK